MASFTNQTKTSAASFTADTQNAASFTPQNKSDVLFPGLFDSGLFDQSSFDTTTPTISTVWTDQNKN